VCIDNRSQVFLFVFTASFQPDPQGLEFDCFCQSRIKMSPFWGDLRFKISPLVFAKENCLVMVSFSNIKEKEQ